PVAIVSNAVPSFRIDRCIVTRIVVGADPGASRTDTPTWYVAPLASWLVRLRLGPWKLAVRPVVFRLCVPVKAASVVLVRVTVVLGRRGIQFCSVPSSKSLLIGATSAEVMRKV